MSSFQGSDQIEEIPPIGSKSRVMKGLIQRAGDGFVDSFGIALEIASEKVREEVSCPISKGRSHTDLKMMMIILNEGVKGDPGNSPPGSFSFCLYGSLDKGGVMLVNLQFSES